MHAFVVNHGLKTGGLGAGRAGRAPEGPGAPAPPAAEDAAARNEGSTKELAVIDVDTLPSALRRRATPAPVDADDEPGKMRPGDRAPASPMPRVLAVCPSEYDCTSENLTLLVTGAASLLLPLPTIALGVIPTVAPTPVTPLPPRAADADPAASLSNRFDVLRMLRSWRPLLSAAGGRNAAASIDSTVDGWKKRDV